MATLNFLCSHIMLYMPPIMCVLLIFYEANNLIFTYNVPMLFELFSEKVRVKKQPRSF